MKAVAEARVTAGIAIAFALALGGCAGWLSTEPTKVDPIEAKYIEAETQLKNVYGAMERLAGKEVRARAGGAPAGSIVSRADYFTTLDRLDTFKTVLREGRKLTTAGSCLDVARFGDVDLKGCLNREQIALLLLQILTRFNENDGRL